MLRNRKSDVIILNVLFKMIRVSFRALALSTKRNWAVLLTNLLSASFLTSRSRKSYTNVS